jgi:adenosine deaminase
MVTTEQIRRAPKVLLHDHLDGGVRPETLVELADEGGYRGLPTTDPAALAEHIRRAASRGSLEAYLETFAHTTGVMQTAEGIERVAFECGADLAADGVVHAEVRMAPELCTRGRLGLDDAVEAMLAGFARARQAHGIALGLLLCGMRGGPHVRAAADTAVRWGERGVIGFDVAGAEAAHPPDAYLDAFRAVQHAGLHVTIHAGESAGLDSIRAAAVDCGAERLGHGVRLVDDITPATGTPGTRTDARVGRLAAWIRDRQVPLELCPTSNVHTAAAPSVDAHPFGLLRQLGFRVTVNTDNRLMSGVSLTSELAAVAAAFDLDLDDVEALQVAAAQSLFAPVAERRRLVAEVIRPGFAALAGRAS